MEACFQPQSHYSGTLFWPHDSLWWHLLIVNSSLNLYDAFGPWSEIFSPYDKHSKEAHMQSRALLLTAITSKYKPISVCIYWQDIRCV